MAATRVAASDPVAPAIRMSSASRSVSPVTRAHEKPQRDDRERMLAATERLAALLADAGPNITVNPIGDEHEELPENFRRLTPDGRTLDAGTPHGAAPSAATGRARGRIRAGGGAAAETSGLNPATDPLASPPEPRATVASPAATGTRDRFASLAGTGEQPPKLPTPERAIA